MTIICIDGNIGSGKTSILNYLHKYHRISIDLEPIENWQPYLTKFYKDKTDLFKFQVRIWLDRCWIQEKIDNTLILMERSPYFIRNCFIEVALTEKYITEKEYNILQELHNKTDNTWCCNTYIYLRSDPEKCFNRINKRNRPDECYISLDYIKLLHNIHEKNYEEAKKNNMNIILIDVEDKTISEICTDIYNLDNIKKFI